ncbi:oligosaccharide flippase family protein [Micromonospora sp. NPDC006766]|uniref:lipopolysaccharide biosynthesis protein n=1 Tax=Micromonospora sp. NPDC006766 TaxID=3154778 RepID=UPI0033D0CAEF
MIGRRGLAAQTVVLVVAGAGSQTLYAIVVALVASRAGPAAFGSAAGAMGVGGMLVGVVDFGFNAFSVRELAAGRITEESYWNRLRVLFAVAVAGALGITLAGVSTSRPEFGLVAALVLLSRTAINGVVVPLRAARRVVKVAAVLLLERLVTLVLAILLLATTAAGALVVLWWSLAVGALAAVTAGVLLGDPPRPRWVPTGLTEPWRATAGYGRFSLAVSATSLDVTLLAATGGSTQAGIYSAVSRWTQPVQFFAQAYSSAAAPAIAQASSSRAALHAVRRSLWLLCGAVVTCGALVALAPTAVSLVLGDTYRQSAGVLMVLAIGAAVVVVNQPLATFLQSRGHEKMVGNCTVGTVTLQLVGVCLTAGPIGARGAAWAYGAAQLALTVLLAAYALLLVRRQRRSGGDRPRPGVRVPALAADARGAGG